MSKFIDFDSFMEETKQEPVIIRIFGKDEELPASLPADIVLEIVRRNKNGEDSLSDADTFSMAERIFGGKLQEWCDKGLTVDQLEALIVKVMAMYTNKRKNNSSKSGQTAQGGKAKTPRRR